MKDLLATLDTLKRPRLLISAARMATPEYRRETHLARHLGDRVLPHSAEALERLIEIENDIDHDRRTRAAGYSTVRHVDVLIAIMGEARILRATAPISVTSAKVTGEPGARDRTAAPVLS